MQNHDIEKLIDDCRYRDVNKETVKQRSDVFRIHVTGKALVKNMIKGINENAQFYGNELSFDKYVFESLLITKFKYLLTILLPMENVRDISDLLDQKKEDKREEDHTDLRAIRKELKDLQIDFRDFPEKDPKPQYIKWINEMIMNTVYYCAVYSFSYQSYMDFCRLLHEYIKNHKEKEKSNEIRKNNSRNRRDKRGGDGYSDRSRSGKRPHRRAKRKGYRSRVSGRGGTGASRTHRGEHRTGGGDTWDT